jgi:hypothetical protein
MSIGRMKDLKMRDLGLFIMNLGDKNLLWINKARATDKTYVWMSVWW